MKTPPTRREVLAEAARASLILGIGALAGCERRRPMPRTLATALERMTREEKPGLVVAIPNDPEEASDLGAALVAASDHGFGTSAGSSSVFGAQAARESEFREILLVAVVVCLDEDQIEMGIRGAKPNEIALRIDVDGSREEGIEIKPGDRASYIGLAEACRRLIHGNANERLAARAERSVGTWTRRPPEALQKFVEVAPTPDIGQRIDEIAGFIWRGKSIAGRGSPIDSWRDYATQVLRRTGDVADRNEFEALVASAREHASLLIHWRIESTTKSVRERAQALLKLAFLAADSDREDGLLPFGIGASWSDESGGLGSSTGCGGCGMSIVRRTATRKFVSFAAR